MQDKHLYEYAVIRAVPRVEREEFINVGLILLCKRKKYLRFQYANHQNKLLILCNDFDYEQLVQNLESFKKICEGNSKAGHIAQLEVEERFRWITAVKSSSIQSSRPHPGFSSDLEMTFARLFEELVE